MRSYHRELIRGIFLLSLFFWLPACGVGPSILTPPDFAARHREVQGDLFQKAEESYRRQAYRQAWREYGVYLERYPRGSQAMVARLRLAELVGLLGDWHDSLRRYQSLLNQQPQPDIALKARYGVGRAYFKLGQYQQSLRVLENLTADELPPDLRFSTQALLTEIALKQNLVPQAFTRLRLAVKDLASGDREWFNDLQTRLVEQATPEELENLANLYRDTPQSAILLLRLATLAQKAGQGDVARKWAEILKERFPESKEAASLEKMLRGQTRLVACLLPLSGEFANPGRHVKQGMELAAKGTPLELSFRDTPNDLGPLAQLVRDLAADPRVLAILGPLRSSAVQGAAQVAQEAKMPLIALSQKEGVTQTGDFIFQTFLTSRQQVRALLRHTLGRGLKRYAVLYPDSGYGQAFMKQFLEEAAIQGIEVVSQEPYSPSTRDFAPALATLKAIYHPEQAAPGFEGLFIPDDASAVAAAAGQLEAYGLKNLQLLGTNLLHVPDLPEAEARALNGIIFPDAFFARDNSPGVQEFIAAYRQQYNENPDYLAAQGYAVARMLLKALEGEKDLPRADLPQRLLSLKALPDLPWFKGFNAQREGELSLYILTIKDGAVESAQ
jgi:ABC-type branched-subunit amino acid transport system substrate-binding protein